MIQPAREAANFDAIPRLNEHPVTARRNRRLVRGERYGRDEEEGAEAEQYRASEKFIHHCEITSEGAGLKKFKGGRHALF